MKIALISDIHSNLFYLQEVLKRVKKEKVNAIYCLGDLIGYYDKADEVVALLRENNIQSVKGNHEQYLLGISDYNRDNEHIYGIENQKSILSEENMEFLRNLPESLEVSIEGKKFYMTHSLPNNCLQYAYSVKDLDKKFISNYDYYCFGHTHIPMVSYQYGTCIINSGAVGQPRDYTKKPTFALVDLLKDSVTIVKVDVDENEYSKSLLEKGFSEKLIKILQRERGQ